MNAQNFSIHMAQPKLEEIVKQFFARHGLVQQHLLVAVSGGIDSVVLLHVLLHMKQDLHFQLSILHVNHSLRGNESDGDEQFVRTLASRYRVPVCIEKVNTRSFAKEKKVSIQEAARELRYAFFDTTKKSLHASAILTAHTANDNAETMLFNFFRGSGIDGVAGIPAFHKEKNIFRPLMRATRKEIAAYAKTYRLKWREDSSNVSEKYNRNFIRKSIIPLIENKINPSLVQTLTTEAAIFQQCKEFIAEVVTREFDETVHTQNNRVSIDVEKISQRHSFLQQMLFKYLFLQLGIEPHFERIDALRAFLSLQKGSRIELGRGWIAERTTDKIICSNAPVQDFFISMDGAGTVTTDTFTFSIARSARAKHFSKNSFVEYVNADMLSFPIVIRSWKSGDSFMPLGMSKHKKLSDFFVDQKISRSEKNAIPIVESNKAIVWVAGIRLDNRFKITPATKNIYKLHITFHNQ